MNAKVRRAIAGCLYLGVLAWEVCQDWEMGLFQYYRFILEGDLRWILRRPLMLLPLLCIAALAALALMAFRRRVPLFAKIACTAVVAVRLILPYASPGTLRAFYEDRFVILTALGVAATLIASFALLKTDKLYDEIGAEKEGGYYEDLYHQGVISREEYDEMTRDR